MEIHKRIRPMTYQTRAECVIDVTRLMEHVPMESFVIESEFSPGVVLTFASPDGYETIQAAMNRVPDSHIMSRCLFVMPVGTAPALVTNRVNSNQNFRR